MRLMIDMDDVLDMFHSVENFNGKFDGNGFTISNYDGEHGLFVSIAGGEVKNFTTKPWNTTIKHQQSYHHKLNIHLLYLLILLALTVKDRL